MRGKPASSQGPTKEGTGDSWEAGGVWGTAQSWKDDGSVDSVSWATCEGRDKACLATTGPRAQLA